MVTRSSPTAAERAELNALSVRLLAAAMATRRTEALLVRAQATCLAWLSVGDRSMRCGYPSVSGVALEYLGMSPRSVRERLALHRLFVRFPQVERAFLEGDLSACQALAVSPILEDLDPDEETTLRRWIARAGHVSVRELRYEVRLQRARKALAGSADVRDTRAVGAAPSVSGGDAGVPTTPDDTAPAGEEAATASLHSNSTSVSIADTIDPSSPDAIDPDGRTLSFTAPVGFQVLFDQTIELARKVIGYDAPIHECLASILAEAHWPGIGSTPAHRDRMIRPPAAIPLSPRTDVPFRPDAIAHARNTLSQVYLYIQDVFSLAESGEPTSCRDALDRLRQIELLRCPQRILFAHLIRDLRRTYAMDILGYRSMADLVEDQLGVSERSARNRVAESLLYETDKEMEEAVGRGEISLMQAHLVRKMRGSGEIGPFIERARRLSWRQLQREYRLLELLRKCGLGGLSRKPLQQAEAEEALIDAMGGDREEIDRRLKRMGIPEVPGKGAKDPAQNYIVMERLEALVEMLASRIWDEMPQVGGLDRGLSADLALESMKRERMEEITGDAGQSNQGSDRQVSAAGEAQANLQSNQQAEPIGAIDPLLPQVGRVHRLYPCSDPNPRRIVVVVETIHDPQGEVTTMESKYSVAIDVHRRSWSVAGCLGKEICLRHRQEPSTEVLLKVLSRRGMDASNTRIAYEAGPTGYWLHDELRERGFEVLVVSPAHIPRCPGERVKTDSRDCRDLAVNLDAGRVRGISVPTAEERAIRDLVRTRHQLVEGRASILRMIKSKLLFLGIDYGKRRHWGKRYRTYLLDLPLAPGHREAIVHLVEVVDILTGQVRQIEVELEAYFSSAQNRAQRAVLESIPGIAWRGAVVILAEIRNTSRFAKAGHFASYLGLTPSEHSSGETVRRGRITRQGNGYVRAILVEAAWIAVRSDPKLKALYERYCIRMGRKRAVVAVARKMAVMIWRMLQTGEVYRAAEI